LVSGLNLYGESEAPLEQAIINNHYRIVQRLLAIPIRFLDHTQVDNELCLMIAGYLGDPSNITELSKFKKEIDARNGPWNIYFTERDSILYILHNIHYEVRVRLGICNY